MLATLTVVYNQEYPLEIHSFQRFELLKLISIELKFRFKTKASTKLCFLLKKCKFYKKE